MTPLLRWLAVLAVVTGLGALKLGNQFVIDDDDLIVESNVLADTSRLTKLPFESAKGGTASASFNARHKVNTYRPLTMATFYWDYWLSGKSPLGYHLTNLLLHLVVVGLVGLLAHRLLGPHAAWAWLPALWLGIHPTLSEAHVWINGRSDVLAAAFSIGALLLHLRAEERPTRAWALRTGSAFCLLLGLLSKEVALLVLPVALIWDLGLFRPRPAHARRVLSFVLSQLPLFLATIGYFALRRNALSGMSMGQTETLLPALFRLPYLWFDGLFQLILPSHTAMRVLSEEYAHIAQTWFIVAWVGAILLAALLLRVRKSWPLLGLGAFFYAVGLAPAVLVTWPGFGRYLYLPFVGIAIALTHAMARAWDAPNVHPSLRRAAPWAAGAYASVLGLLFFIAVQNYGDYESFHQAMVDESPEVSYGWGGLAVAWGRQGKHTEAREALRQAIARSPNTRRYWLNLGGSSALAGDHEEALKAARYGIDHGDPSCDFYNVGALAMMNENPQTTVTFLLDGLLVEPGHKGCLRNLSLLTSRHPAKDIYRSLLRTSLSQARYAPLAPIVRPMLAE